MAKNNMDQDILKVLFSEQEIHDRIQEMGDQLYDKFHDRDPLFVGVLNGCFLFMAILFAMTAVLVGVALKKFNDKLE